MKTKEKYTKEYCEENCSHVLQDNNCVVMLGNICFVKRELYTFYLSKDFLSINIRTVNNELHTVNYDDKQSTICAYHFLFHSLKD